LLDLQSRGELTVIKASGISTWQVLRAPLIAVVLGFGTLTVVADTLTVLLMRTLSVSLPQTTGQAIWLEQTGDGEHYVLRAEHAQPGGRVLEGVIFFLPEALNGPRIHAPLAELRDGAWFIEKGTRFAADAVPRNFRDLSLPTDATPGDLGARLASPNDLTVFELVQIAALRISDPRLRSGVYTRLAKLVALPLALGASLVVGFAFATGYRRTNKYGGTVLYGIVLGFVVYLIMEMAATAGTAGILQPAFAAFAPAFVALVVGTTVLLFREDGRRR
jgi:lipopolysaccharide export system permease protein